MKIRLENTTAAGHRAAYEVRAQMQRNYELMAAMQNAGQRVYHDSVMMRQPFMFLRPPLAVTADTPPNQLLAAQVDAEINSIANNR